MATSDQVASADNPSRPGPREEVGDRRATLVLAEETPEQRAEDAAAITRLARRHLDAGAAGVVLAMLGVGPDVPDGDEPDGEEPAPEESAPATPLPPINHGTRSGYEQHRTRGDMPACRPCREATAAYQRSRDAARRATGGAQ